MIRKRIAQSISCNYINNKIDILLGNEPEVGVYLDSEKETLRIKNNKEKSILSKPSPSINTTDNKKLLIK